MVWNLSKAFLIAIALLLPVFFNTYVSHSSLEVVAQSAGNPGGIIWTTWGGLRNETGGDVATDAQGSMYVAGSTYSFGVGSAEAVLLKFDANGSILWARTWGGARFDGGKGVVVGKDGYIYMAGDTESFSNSSKVFLVKFDPDGNLVWQRMWGGGADEHVQGMCLNPSGEMYLTGSTRSIDAGKDDVFLLKFASTGGLEWQRMWGGSGSLLTEGIACDLTGNIYVTGFVQGVDTQESGILLRFNSTGNLQWQQAWNGTRRDSGSKVAVDSMANVYVTGRTSSFGAGGDDVSILKFNSTGNFTWGKTWGGSLTDAGLGIAVNSSGSVLISGFTSFRCCGSLVNLTNAFILSVSSSGVLISTPIICIDNSNFTTLKFDQFGNAIATGSMANYGGFWPEFFYSGILTLGDAPFSLHSPNLVNKTRVLPVGSPNGTVLAPQGSELTTTNYEPGHILLAKVLTHPVSYVITSGSGVRLDGTYIAARSLVNFTEGTYVARGFVSVPAFYGSSLNSWNATGGVFVRFPMLVETPVDVLGSGSLTQIYFPGPAFQASVVFLVILALPLSIIGRRTVRHNATKARITQK